MKKHVQIKNSYKIWRPSVMKNLIDYHAPTEKHTALIIEWWLHNIIYYLTKPFGILKSINARCRDVDLMVEVKPESEGEE